MSKIRIHKQQLRYERASDILCKNRDRFNKHLAKQMQFFNKLFRGGDKNSKAPPPSTLKSEEEKLAQSKIRVEKLLDNLEGIIQTFDERENKLDHKIELLRNKAKDLLRVEKKKQARKYAEEEIKLFNRAERYSQRKKLLIDKKYKLEQAVINMDYPWMERRQNIILDEYEEAEIRQKEIERRNQIISLEQQGLDVEDLLNELIEELRVQEKKKTNQVNPGKEVSINSNTFKAKNKVVEKIEEMVASL